MTKKLLLITATLIAFYYCFRFGYIWTAYGHGRQLLGIPFAVMMLIITINYFLHKTLFRKQRVFLFGVTYFLTLAAFSATIEIIRAKKENYFGFLYYEPGGYVNKIFLAWLIIGAFTYLLLLKKLKTSEHTRDNKLQVDNTL